jgi:hypothetical protein
MSWAGQEIPMIVVIAVLDAGGIGLPFLAWWNLRAPERRREFWLRANARPRLTIAMYSPRCRGDHLGGRHVRAERRRWVDLVGSDSPHRWIARDHDHLDRLFASDTAR